MVDRDKKLVQVKASLVLQKLTISKELERLKAELKSGNLAANMQIALDHAKKGRLKSLAAIRYKLDHIHQARQDNMAVLMSIFRRIDNLSRLTFNGSAYQSVLEWNRQVEGKHKLLREPEQDYTSSGSGSFQTQGGSGKAPLPQVSVGSDWFRYSDRTSAIGHTFTPQLEQRLPGDYYGQAGGMEKKRGSSRGQLPPLMQSSSATSYRLPSRKPPKSKSSTNIGAGYISI